MFDLSKAPEYFQTYASGLRGKSNADLWRELGVFFENPRTRVISKDDGFRVCAILNEFERRLGVWLGLELRLPAEHTTVCPKCKGTAIKRRYCAAAGNQICSLAVSEHLHLVCSGCRFEWIDACADAP